MGEEKLGLSVTGEGKGSISQPVIWVGKQTETLSSCSNKMGG